jgi:hypothetical protein
MRTGECQLRLMPRKKLSRTKTKRKENKRNTLLSTFAGK